MGGKGNAIIGLGLFLGLASVSPSVEACTTTFHASLSTDAVSVEDVGQEYRRSDVYVYIPIEVGDKLLTKQASSLLDKKVSIKYVGEDTYSFSIKVKNKTPYTVKDIVLEQDITTSSFEENSLRATRVRSVAPYITESISIFPTDITPERVMIGLPSLEPGEEIKVSYNVVGEPKLPKIYTTSPKEITREKKKRVLVLVGKYSIFFGYGKAKAKDINIENIKEVLKNLNGMGFEPVIKVVGIADGKAKSEESNLRVARSRANFITKSLFGEGLACLMNKGLAENSNPY